MSRDGVPVVFHDYELDRLTAFSGHVSDLAWAELAGVGLKGSEDCIERLDNVLATIGSRAPVLVEVKDQSGLPGADNRRVDQIIGWTVKDACAHHGCDVAVMSFNPAYISALSWLGSDIPRGLTTGSVAEYPDHLPTEIRTALAGIAAFEPDMDFISHDHLHLESPRIAELKAAGTSILCWTVRSPEEEARARQVADNITFEGYAA